MEFKELADLVTKRDEAWGAFMKTNDERLVAIEKGLPTGEIQAKLDAINADLAEIRKTAEELEKKSNRPQVGADGKEITAEQAEYKKAFGDYMRKGNTNGLAELQQKAMNSSSDPDGGYLVLPEMDMAIDRVVPTISSMARLADNVTIGSSKWEKLMKTSGMSLAWVADGGTNGETTEPQYAKVTIDVHTAEIEPWVYNETLQDSFYNLESDLANEAAIGFGEGVGAALITGNGVGQPRGIASYTFVANSSYTWGNVGYIASGLSGGFTTSAPADKVISLQHSLKQQYRPGAVFLTNDSTLGVMRQLKDGSGSYYLWNPDPAAGFGGRFLGSPVEIDDNIAAAGAGSYSLFYLNPKRAYKVVNRAGTTLIRDNITSKGQTKFNFRKRIGGGIYNYEAIKALRFATS